MKADREIRLIYIGKVVPKQSARSMAIPYWDNVKNKCAAFIRVYQKVEIKKFEENVRMEALNQKPRAFPNFRGAIMVKSLQIRIKAPKSMSKRMLAQIDAGSKIYRTERPDITDNLMKGIFDALEGIYYKNDSQIVKLMDIEKIYAREDGFTLILKGMNNIESPLF